MSEANNQKYVTVKKASEIVGVADQTIRNAIANKKLNASVVPANNNRGSTTFIEYEELMAWASARKKRMTTIPGVATLTIDDLAEELLKRIQNAYEEGYKAGVQAAKQEYLDAIKGVKL